MSRQATFAVLLLAICGSCATATDAPAEMDSGKHDVLLLMPSGPIHIRVAIAETGKPLEQMRRDFMTRLVQQLDIDQDGLLGRDETTKHPLFVSGRRFTGNKFLDSLRSKKPYTSEEIRLAIDRAGGQLVTFRQNDALVDQDLSVFRVLDEDQSGRIERAEMRTAAARIAARDLDFDQCITFDEFMDQPPEPLNPAVISTDTAEPPPNIYSDLMRNAAEPTMAQRLIRSYDLNKDAHLSPQELKWTEARCAVLDTSGDGLVSAQELSRLRFASPDLELAVDFATETGASLQRIRSQETLIVKQERDNVLAMQAGDLSIRVGYRNRDPMAEAEENARNAFNAIDVDANGYLDRKEIIEHPRFERYLFDAMDSDADERVFANEMLAYVRSYTEPASTSCQLTLLNMGSGYFQMLDRNSDGRISIRELRASEEYLLAATNDADTINPSRTNKNFRMEIQRGGVSLFGRVDRPEAESPSALLMPPTGPIWFQRMDRNADGDLTWDEFLGPREVYHQLDADQDGLVDQAEAARAK